MRFDVPVVGLGTVETMKRSGATALAIEASRTLLFDRARLIEAADEAGIAIQAFATVQTDAPSGTGGDSTGAKAR
jgi:DUF1009 family protein